MVKREDIQIVIPIDFSGRPNGILISFKTPIDGHEGSIFIMDHEIRPVFEMWAKRPNNNLGHVLWHMENPQRRFPCDECKDL